MVIPVEGFDTQDTGPAWIRMHIPLARGHPCPSLAGPPYNCIMRRGGALTPSGAGLPSGFHKFTHRPRSATALLSAARASSLVVADHARPVLMPVQSERSEEHAGRVGRSSDLGGVVEACGTTYSNEGTTLCFEDSNAESLARIAERHRKSRLAGLGIPYPLMIPM